MRVAIETIGIQYEFVSSSFIENETGIYAFIKKKET